MSLRTGGYAAILGSLVWLAGFLANLLDGSDEAWPTSGIILAGALILIVGIAGLSGFAARRNPGLAWAAFLTPAIGTFLMALGLVGMAILPDEGGFNAWGLGMLGLVTLMAGSGLFAIVSWMTGPLSRAGTALLGTAGVLAIPGTIALLGLVTWDPYVQYLLFGMLLAFTGGWLLSGIAAVRAGQPRAAIAGGAA